MSKQHQKPQPELVSAYEFARRKGVKAQAVYYRIKETGEISTIQIGKRIAIDWLANKHVEFPNAERYVSKDQNDTTNEDRKETVQMD